MRKSWLIGDSQILHKRWTWIFLAIGILLRLERYALDMPIWGDEAFIGLNIVRRGYQKLLLPLDDFQVAPLGFLFSQRFAFELLGMSEYAMRLIPMIVGIVGLILFAVWALSLTPGRPALISVGIMAVGVYSVRHAVELKPYGFDLCAAMLLLLPATLFLQRRQKRWLVILIVLTPIALVMSFPAIFVAGGVALALAVSLRNPKPSQLILIALFGLTMLLSFWFFDYKVSEIQFPKDASFLSDYWKDAFPPAKPLELLLWLISTHTGNMFAYPYGGSHGISTPDFILFVVGACVLIRSRNLSLMILLLVPFTLTFVAAAMHRYPYGGSARVAQHLAPAIILIMGMGISWLIDRAKTSVARFYFGGGVVVTLLCFGVGLGIVMFVHPYQTLPDAQVRQLVRSTTAHADADTNIVILQRQKDIGLTYQWYLLESGRTLIWNGIGNYGWIRMPDPVLVISTAPIPMSNLEEDLRHNVGRAPTFHEFRLIPWRNILKSGPDQWEVFLFPAG